MYAVDSLDEVLNFEGVPGHSPGAPMPQILANDDSLVLAYEVAPSGEDMRSSNLSCRALIISVHRTIKDTVMIEPQQEALAVGTRGPQLWANSC
jgi:hypothetical protein